jgi:glycosyltransferase involved in cell wall biosynthesis/SAM-dependent methyltransferase
MTHPTMRVVHVITKLPVGGATESVLALCRWVDPNDVVQCIASGADLDAEGSLLPSALRVARVEMVPSLVRRAAPWRDVVAVVQLVRLLRREQPDLVHTHSSKAGVLGRIAARLADVPAVHGVHGWSFHDEMRPAARRLAVSIERLLARWSAAIVVEGAPDLEKGLAHRIGRREQYRLVRNGIDVDAIAGHRGERAALRSELGIAEGVPVVGSVGGLRAQKDPLSLLRAFALVRTTVSDARLVIVGDGPLRDEAVAVAEELGLSDAVTLLGSRRDAARWYGAFDVFAMASLWEGLPRTATEAMAAGVPVVATTVDGLSELITHDVDGLLVPPRDAAALADAITVLLQDRERASRLATRATHRVAEFDVRAMAADTVATYRSLVSTPSRARTSVVSTTSVAQHELDDDQLAHFDYDYVTPEVFSVIEGLIGPVRNQRCVDLGGGTGRFADRLLDAGARDVVVLDDSQLLLDRAAPRRGKHLVRASLFDADVVIPPRSISAGDLVGWADLVSINLVLHHLVHAARNVCDTNVVAALEIARRLLSPSGRLLVIENVYEGPMGSDAPGRIIHSLTSSARSAALARRAGANTAGVGVRFRSRTAWQRLFESAGFEVTTDAPGDDLVLRDAVRRGLALSSARNHLFVLRPVATVPIVDLRSGSTVVV